MTIPGRWTFRGHALDTTRPVIMGIVNVTPDSFSDGGKFIDPENAIRHAVDLVKQGADIIDIGGESTRPGSAPVLLQEEIDRVIPVIEGIKGKGITTPISIDTRKVKVAGKAVKAGAVIVNDVAALDDEPELADLIAGGNLGAVLMHMQGRPKLMQAEPHYDDVIGEIGEFFEERLDFAIGRGIPKENIILDPGIGFGKLLRHNLEILRRCGEWLKYGRPLMIGPSRKRFIGEILGNDVTDRLYGTIGACVTALNSGARIFRVHDVKAVREAIEVAYSILNDTGSNHE
ncbi:dihydropteroate synthase [bacterium]|nr:dihydropteroate synthase [bacterium]